jgi:hypothetical protein
VVSLIAQFFLTKLMQIYFERSMNDIDGPFMAKRVYSNIFQDGRLDLTAVPYALEDAVAELRKSGVPESRWATYVHVGS